MFNPISTYRIQFHKGFNFDALLRIIPYLQQLGVKTIYASPIFKAVPGSMHGYDVTDPNTINPEIGTLEQLYQINKTLKAVGISWLQDIVPNHMALHQNNVWLMDVLKNGPRSPYASYFDIDVTHPEFAGKLMLPILSCSLDEALSSNTLQLAKQDRDLILQCGDFCLPLTNDSIALVGDKPLDEANKDTALLSTITQQQHYLLCNHADTNKRINYRRFFTINGLISLNMQHEVVFTDYHKLIKKLCDDGVFQGVRVDHIDGLYNPIEYLHRLRTLLGKDSYITVEKILEHGEALPAAWPIAGTTGYDFLAIVNNLLISSAGKKKLTKYYRNITNNNLHILSIGHSKKKQILTAYMLGDLENLYRIASRILKKQDILPSDQLTETISEFLARYPVYRQYGAPPLQTDRATVIEILSQLEQEKHLTEGTQQLSKLLLQKVSDNKQDNEDVSYFYRRCMQLTGPLMAKGIEDTLMYTWNSFIGQNEVGDHPANKGYSIQDFHEQMLQRQKAWPLTMNATATHDTKRGEDARARLAFLTEVPDEWLDAVKHWHILAKDLLTDIDPNDEYLVYQALLAAWPPGNQDLEEFNIRFKKYIIKAMREAKVHTNWQAPNEQYERQITDFSEWLLKSEDFKTSMCKLLQTINEGSTINALTQVILKMTCPGIPDSYQGNELWDFSMVDPDNRRPVNYDDRIRRLADMRKLSPTLWQDLWANRTDGTIKQILTQTLLKERSISPEVWAEGEYIPLNITGQYKKHILAFARQHAHTTYVVILPLHLASVMQEQVGCITDLDWKDTTVQMPETPDNKWINVLTNEELHFTNFCSIRNASGLLPFTILKSAHRPGKRSSGVLLPIFSLATAFGMGDFGYGAFSFIDFLKNSYQKHWQILPINPTVAGEAHSPYSCISGMAIDTLFIAPEMLADDGLLHKDELRKWETTPTGNINYDQCKTTKESILALAWQRFNSGSFEKMHFEFDEFCAEHANWLHDFALYVCIKQAHKFDPWHKWPMPYRTRQQVALSTFANTHTQEIKRIKWLQYLAARQWIALRKYANNRGVSIFGDMPFYVSYDSVDVWANPELFCISPDGTMTGVAGVPPDYFSKTGQLWNMPTYNWGTIKQTNYEWWIRRLKRNLQLFDLIRIDHFRAFEAYWQVEPGQETAEYGKWIKGPGMDFFNVAQQQIGRLPFVAEDLGEEMEDVYHLRNETGLPGMKVLQFAWGDNMSISVDVPHNHTENSIAYTGTHDNNTVRGWWMEEAKKEDKNRIVEYTGRTINANNVHTSLLRIAYASVARVAIAPIQDILGLGSEARINTPGIATGNWIFRLQPGMITHKLEKQLKHLAEIYNRH